MSCWVGWVWGMVGGVHLRGGTGTVHPYAQLASELVIWHAMEQIEVEGLPRTFGGLQM